MKELVEAMKKAKAEGYNAFGIRVIENEAWRSECRRCLPG